MVLLLAALLAGCAAEPIRSPSAPDPTTDIQSIAAIQNWTAVGRVAIQRGNEGWSASLRWRKRGAKFQLRLTAPLGQGTYQLSGDDAQVELVMPDGSRYYAANAQALMETHLGWGIPVAGAEYWLRGLVAPDSAPNHINRDDAGRMLDMEQQGWRISVLRRVVIDNLSLPSKLFMHISDLKVRIAISSWKLGNT